ncbi:MAG TPA: GGDEF domain-containing protein [Gemmatimonadales bacterium]|nr:GGDEF domain-containing protein [Gemmatimonadales bacterium]
MKFRRGAWIAPALAVLGGGLLVEAVSRGTAWTLLGVASGLMLGLALRWSAGRAIAAGLSDTESFDLPHTLDLLRRAHDARAGWAIGLAQGPVEVIGDAPFQEEGAESRRGAAFVQLASVDGRVHVANEVEGTYVAIGDFPYGGALLLNGRGLDQERVTAAVDDLRRLMETMRLAERQALEGHGQLVARQLSIGIAGAQTLEGIARAGAELAQQLAQRGTAVVIRNVRERDAMQVLAVSTAADKRLAGRRLESEAPVSRAIQGGVPIVTTGGEDIFGAGMPERRRHERAGAAYPLMDGRSVIGALVILGREISPRDRIEALVAELGPRLAAAKAVHDAEQRAVLDHLTGLRNRGEFQRVLEAYHTQQHPPPASLVYVDLDHFKRLNDTLGHAAGDAALKHIARVLEQAVREGDLVARIGGEEFAVWLPHAQLGEAWEVAERIRASVADTIWQWSGTAYPLTTSCGVATYPEPIGEILNLPAAADAALYHAKELGRNRVEKAARSG